MLAENKEKFKKLENKVGEIFSRFLTPNQYSVISLLFALFCFSCLVKENLILALLSFFIASFLDFIDGAVARIIQKVTKRGAYIDTICDRYVEGIVLAGFLFLPFPKFIFSSKIWVFFTLFGSLLTTYAKAAAKEKGILEKELKRGLVARGERMVLEFLAIFFGIFNLSSMLLLIVLLAVLSNITAIERIFVVLGEAD